MYGFKSRPGYQNLITMKGFVMEITDIKDVKVGDILYISDVVENSTYCGILMRKELLDNLSIYNGKIHVNESIYNSLVETNFIYFILLFIYPTSIISKIERVEEYKPLPKIENGDILVVKDTFGNDQVGIVINDFLYYINIKGYDSINKSVKNNVLSKIEKIYRAKKPHFLCLSDDKLFMLKKLNFSNFNLIYKKTLNYNKVKDFLISSIIYKELSNININITDDCTMKDLWEKVKHNKKIVLHIIDVLYANSEISEFFNITEKRIQYYYNCIHNDFCEFIENPFDISKN